MESLKQKKEDNGKEQEYDLSSEEEKSESDDEPAFVLSRKPPKVPKK